MNPYVYIETQKLAREAFFSSDILSEELNSYYALLQSESYRIGWDTTLLNLSHPERAHKVPMLVLGGRDDKTVSCAEIEETASAYNVHSEFFPGMAHD